MRYLFTAVMMLSAALTASSAYAQGVPGWQVGWGSAAAVPLDPWMMVAFAIFLGVALVWTQRRHSRFGTYLVVAGGLALAAVSSYQIRDAGANGSCNFDLRPPSGVLTRYCEQGPPDESVRPLGASPMVVGGPAPLSVCNNTGAPVQLVITPLNGADINGSAPTPTCGTSLATGATCYLPCPSQQGG